MPSDRQIENCAEWYWLTSMPQAGLRAFLLQMCFKLQCIFSFNPSSRLTSLPTRGFFFSIHPSAKLSIPQASLRAFRRVTVTRFGREHSTFQSQAGSHSIGNIGANFIALLKKLFQSQAGSHSIGNIAQTVMAVLSTISFNPRREAIPLATQIIGNPFLIGVKVSIPGGKPFHWRPLIGMGRVK